jgi:hypothetical protein
LSEHFCTACPNGRLPDYDKLEECCGLKLCGKPARFKVRTTLLSGEDRDEWLCAEHWDLLETYERDTGFMFPYFWHSHD